MTSPTNPASLPTLPQEVLEQVVHATATTPHARQTLQTFSLLSRELLPRARGHLFETVSFTKATSRHAGFAYPRPNSSRIQAFLVLLEHHNSDGYDQSRLGAPLSVYVKVIRITDVVSPTLYKVAALLPNLKDIVVNSAVHRGSGCMSDQLEWEARHEARGDGQSELDLDDRELMERYWKLSKELWRMELDETLPPLHLDRLYVRRTEPYRQWGAIDTTTFLGRFLHLQAAPVTISALARAARGEKPLFQVSPREVTVRRLELHQSSDLLRSLLRLEHMKRMFVGLKVLLVTLGEKEGLWEPLDLVRVAQSSLERLEVEFLRGYEPKNEENGLPSGFPKLLVPSLKHLSLVHSPRASTQSPYAIPHRIIQILSSALSSSAVLERVSLTLMWSEFDISRDWDEDGTWSSLHSLVVPHRSPFSSLKNLSIRIDLSESAGKELKMYLNHGIGTDGEREREVWEKVDNMLDLKVYGDGEAVSLDGIVAIGDLERTCS